MKARICECALARIVDGCPLSTSHPILCASICELTWLHMCKLGTGHGMWRQRTLVFYCAKWPRTVHWNGSHDRAGYAEEQRLHGEVVHGATTRTKNGERSRKVQNVYEST